MALAARGHAPSVGVRFLDCDHRVLLETIHEIQKAVAADEGRRRAGALLHKLTDFTQVHFALEEEMMAATKYPELARHRREHKRMMERMRELVARHSRRGLPLDREALNLLSKLHATYMQDGDLRYGAWLNETGSRRG